MWALYLSAILFDFDRKKNQAWKPKAWNLIDLFKKRKNKLKPRFIRLVLVHLLPLEKIVIYVHQAWSSMNPKEGNSPWKIIDPLLVVLLLVHGTVSLLGLSKFEFGYKVHLFSRGVMLSAASSYMQQCVCCRWFAPRARHSVSDI